MLEALDHLTVDAARAEIDARWPGALVAIAAADDPREGYWQLDTQAQYPDTVVVSALWNMEPTIDAALANVKAGKFKAEDYGSFSLMKSKGNEMSGYGTFAGKIPIDLKARVAAKEKDMRDGKFKVSVVETEPKTSAK